MQSSLSKLIERGLVANEAVWHMTNPKLDIDSFQSVCESLSLILPNDFKMISSVISYEGSNSMQFLQFDAKEDNWNGVIKNNLEIRKQYTEDSKGLSDMSHILVLADDDGGSVFMITQDSPEKPTPVIWCDYGDMYYYSIHKKFQYPHDEWPSFTAFFEYLVEQEEKKLAEDIT